MSEEEKKAIDYLKNDVVYWLDKGKDFVVIDIEENEKIHSILNLIEKQQKEIEEKRIIIFAGAEKVKQLEKEIEEMREELQMYVDVQNNDIHNYISKDKIREKIKKAKEIKWHTPKLVVEYFEELLKENNEESDPL